MSNRAACTHSTKGFTFVESLVAMLLASLLMSLCVAATAAVRGDVRQLISQRDRVALERFTRALLAAELRGSRRDTDWVAPGGDSLVLRAFRGWAVLCPDSGDAVLSVPRGVRRPDAEKDSVLVLDARGAWVPARLVRRVVTEDGCGSAGGWVERWTLSPAVSGPVARYYESGSYHLVAGALRYRRGRGGRQPLTSALLTRASFLRAGLRSDLELGLIMEEGVGSPQPTATIWNAAPGR